MLRRIPRILGFSGLSFSLFGAAECRAQSASDSVSVVLAAWDSMMGVPPYAHPAGRTSRICLYGQRLAEASGHDSIALIGLLRGLRTAVAERPDLSVEDSCQPKPAETYGIWVVTPAQEPAILAHASVPQFNADGTGRVRIGNVRAGRWGRFISCYLERRGSAWHVLQCETIAVSWHRNVAQPTVGITSVQRTSGSGQREGAGDNQYRSKLASSQLTLASGGSSRTPFNSRRRDHAILSYLASCVCGSVVPGRPPYAGDS